MNLVLKSCKNNLLARKRTENNPDYEYKKTERPNIMKRILTLTAIIFSIGFLFSNAYSSESLKLRINCTVHSTYETFFVQVLEEVCQRNNIILQRNAPPVGQSLILVNQGIDDGDGPRIAGLSASFPNLIPVPEPFGEFHFGAFARSPKIRINDWSDLADLNIAYLHGWKIFDNKVKTAKSITRVQTKDMLFTLLKSGRTDVALLTRLAGNDAISALKFKNIFFDKYE